MRSNIPGDADRDNDVCALLETVTLQDIFSTGGLKIQPVGPTHQRLIWYVQKTTPNGDVQVPVVSIIIPATSMMPIANKMAAAHALARDDFVGVPVGSG